MGAYRKAYAVEARVYDDPDNPNASPYDVALPHTVTTAVFDPDTGDTAKMLILAVANSIAAHMANKDVHTSAAATAAIGAALADLGVHINNGDIHVTKPLKDLWTDGASRATTADGKAQNALNQANANAGEIAALKDAVFNALTANPFTVTFNSISGINVVSGIWNANYQRIEC